MLRGLRLLGVGALVLTASCGGSDEPSATPDAAPSDTGGSIDAATTDSSMSDSGSIRDSDGDVESTDADAASAVDTSVADVAAPSCGKLSLGSLSPLFPLMSEVSGATITYEGCSTKGTAAGAAPAGWNVRIASIASWFRVSRTGARTTLSPEMPATLGEGSPIGLQLVVGTSLAGYDASKAHIVVNLAEFTGACTAAGNRLSLPGHPEATVHYIDKNGADVGSATNVDGFVWITSIVPGSSPFVTPEFTPSVAGCKLSPTQGTGRLPLVVDTVTSVRARVAP